MFSGSGPGPQAPDGCSVQLYARLPYVNDLEAVRQFLKPDLSILELGCGTGRLTRKLLEWGLSVTSVDESPAMLALLPKDASPILSSIEHLKAIQTFDLAMLASCVINNPAEETRRALIASAVKHLRSDGALLIQRHDPEWLASAQLGLMGQAGSINIYLQAVSRRGNLVDMTLQYEEGDDTWKHSFSVESLTEQQIEQLLTEQGVGEVTWHGRGNRWAVAHMVPTAA